MQNSSPEATKQQLQDLKAQAKTVEEQKARYDALEENLIARVEQFKQELDKAQNKKAVVNPILLLLSIILDAAAGALAFFVNATVGGIAIGVATVVGASSIVDETITIIEKAQKSKSAREAARKAREEARNGKGKKGT